MKLKKLTNNLMVEDVNKTIEFYKNILGFEFVMAVAEPEDSRETLMEMPEEKSLVYAMMKNGDVEIVFQEKNSFYEHVPALKGVKVGGSLDFYFEVENIGDLYDELKEKVEIVKELHTTWYGMQEFYFKDCNGYVLCFAERE